MCHPRDVSVVMTTLQFSSGSGSSGVENISGCHSYRVMNFRLFLVDFFTLSCLCMMLSAVMTPSGAGGTSVSMVTGYIFQHVTSENWDSWTVRYIYLSFKKSSFTMSELTGHWSWRNKSFDLISIAITCSLFFSFLTLQSVLTSSKGGQVSLSPGL